MTRILAAIDFSTRSDRALRRATLLAQELKAEVLLAHVVDDDADPEILRDAQRSAEATLEDLAATVVETDGVSCQAHVVSGQTSREIAALAREAKVDLIVIGPPRRNAIRTLFFGATAARSARPGGPPVLLAAGVPGRGYRQALYATDFSDASANAARTAARLGVAARAKTAAVHAYEAPARGLLLRANLTQAEFRAYLVETGLTSRQELERFLKTADIPVEEALVELIETTPAAAILSAAGRIRADLLVVGARGRGAVSQVLLGSVTSDLIAGSEIDLLIAPPP